MRCLKTDFHCRIGDRLYLFDVAQAIFCDRPLILNQSDFNQSAMALLVLVHWRSLL
ncbi:hypothetical protein [Nostoc sp. DedQUE07]|uniref:hypothetical protein n=1 Tax=Nostoc sp. DedQUE07 TaxID=3075392 RepID=UPI002AD32393|nr:hypothetical protein [Nostoc sp. DedQUE07]MDZ8128178.1 hypothetical protein [Nostoc sp. DedQUE07]